MGSLFASCCGSSETQNDYQSVDRDKMREAAERRWQAEESRGIKNIEDVKRKKEAKLELEKMERNVSTSGQGLKIKMLTKSISASSINKKSNKPKMETSISENELIIKPEPLIDNLIFKISSFKPEKNVYPSKERSKTIINLNDFDLNNSEEYDLINAKVNNVKLVVSQYISQLEQRGPKLEELEASCMKLSEHTKDLEQVAVKTKKFYYNDQFYKKYKIFTVFILCFILIMTIPILKILKS